MKRILSLAVAASMLLSAIPAMAETATKATYIPAPYNAEEVDPTKTYLGLCSIRTRMARPSA